MLVSRAVNTISDLLVAGVAAASRRGQLSNEGKDKTAVPAEAATPVSSASDSGAHG
jgi:hypothetical protein